MNFHRWTLLLLVVGSLGASLPAFVAVHPSDLPAPAAERVGEGVEHFRQGRFQEARNVLAGVAASHPNDPLVTFDFGCALAATGEIDAAGDQWQQTTAARATEIAAASFYNLGGLAAEEAESLIGEDPISVTGESRDQVLHRLVKSADQYVECLRIDPAHDPARHNLELVRLLTQRLRELWREDDRARSRRELNAYDFLDTLQSRQQDLRNAAAGLIVPRAETDSGDTTRFPMTRPQIEHDQKTVRGDLAVFLEKVKQLPSSGSADGDMPFETELWADRLAMLSRLTEGASKQMLAAETDLSDFSIDDAVVHQRRASETLHEIDLLVSPFGRLLEQAIASQETLSQATAKVADPGNRPPTDPPPLRPDRQLTSPPVMPASELSWRQNRVSSTIEMLTQKAETRLEEWAGKADPQPQDEDPDGADGDGQRSLQADEIEPGPPDSEALEAQMRRALQLGPSALRRSSAASELLAKEEMPRAVAEQSETLRLLREIRGNPSDDAPQEPSDQDKERDREQQQQDPSEGDPADHQGEQPNDASQSEQQNQQPDSESQSPEEKHQPKQEQPAAGQDDTGTDDGRDGEQASEQDPAQDARSDDPDDLERTESANATDQQTAQSREQVAREQAMSVIRRARERQRQYRDYEKQIRSKLRAASPVDRDW